MEMETERRGRRERGLGSEDERNCDVGCRVCCGVILTAMMSLTAVSLSDAGGDISISFSYVYFSTSL